MHKICSKVFDQNGTFIEKMALDWNGKIEEREDVHKTLEGAITQWRI